MIYEVFYKESIMVDAENIAEAKKTALQTIEETIEVSDLVAFEVEHTV